MMRTTIARPKTTSMLPDRAVLRAQLEETRTSFHALVEAFSDETWQRKSAATVWTIGEVLPHDVNGRAHGFALLVDFLIAVATFAWGVFVTSQAAGYFSAGRREAPWWSKYSRLRRTRAAGDALGLA